MKMPRHAYNSIMQDVAHGTRRPDASSSLSLSYSRLLTLVLILLAPSFSMTSAKKAPKSQSSSSSTQTLSCSFLSLPRCHADADCMDPTNTHGLDPACGDVACEIKTGTCVFDAWVLEGKCFQSNYVFCDKADELCAKGPTDLVAGAGVEAVEGKCRGWKNLECVYRWCPRTGTGVQEGKTTTAIMSQAATTAIMSQATQKTTVTTTSEGTTANPMTSTSQAISTTQGKKDTTVATRQETTTTTMTTTPLAAEDRTQDVTTAAVPPATTIAPEVTATTQAQATTTATPLASTTSKAVITYGRTTTTTTRNPLRGSTLYPPPVYAKRCADFTTVEPTDFLGGLYDYCTVSPPEKTNRNLCCDPALRPTSCNHDQYGSGPRCCFQTGEWGCPSHGTRGAAYCHLSGPIKTDYMLGLIWASQGPFGLPCGTLEVGLLYVEGGCPGSDATIVYLGDGGIGLGSDEGTVFFESRRCTIVSWTPIEVTVNIPYDAELGVGNLVLVRKDGEVAQAVPFDVKPFF